MTDTPAADAAADLLSLADEVWDRADGRPADLRDRDRRPPVPGRAAAERRRRDRSRAPTPGRAAGPDAADPPGRPDAGRAGHPRRARRHARVRAGRRGRVASARWAVDPLDGPQVTFLNIPIFQPLATRRGWRRRCSHAGGRWARGSIATSRTCGLRHGTGSSRRGPWSDSVVAELDDLLARPDDEWPLARPSAADPPGWSGAERDRFAAAIGAAIRDDIRPAFERLAGVPRRRAGADRPRRRPGRARPRPGRRGRVRPPRRRAHDARSRPRGDPSRSASRRSTGSTPSSRSWAGGCSGTSSDRPRRSTGCASIRRSGSRPATRCSPDRRGVARPGERGDPGLVRAAARSALRGRRRWATTRRPTRRSPTTASPPPTAAGRAATTSTRRCPRRGRATRPRRSPSTRPCPATTSRSRSPRSWTDLPAFRRFGGPTAFVEGWGLYTRAPVGRDGPLLRADSTGSAILSFDAWRACRLVVDTGMHALGWSRGQAIDFMLDSHRARREQHRQRGRPLPRAAGPGAGLQDRPARVPRAPGARPKPRSGSAFDIRAFHDVVAGRGHRRAADAPRRHRGLDRADVRLTSS